MSFYSKAGNLCEVLQLFSYLLFLSHKPEVCHSCELLPLIGVGVSEVGSCRLLHLGPLTLQTAQHVLKLLHFGLSTLQTAQHALKLLHLGPSTLKSAQNVLKLHHLGPSTLQILQHVLKLLHLGLPTLQTAQHDLKLPLVRCLSTSLTSTAQKNWGWKHLSDEWYKDVWIRYINKLYWAMKILTSL